MTWKYLHQSSEGVYILDHRLCPEVRAMLAAMASRMPLGGIEARYQQIVEAVAEDLAEVAGWPTLEAMQEDPDREEDLLGFLSEAEDRLTYYPLPTIVRNPDFDPDTYDSDTDADAKGNKPGFFDRFVLMYGHSSILELTGSPAVYTEGQSWYTNYLLFDAPLCSGQEFSTRAVRHKDWPMARECFDIDPIASSVLQEEDNRILRELTGDPDASTQSPPILGDPHPRLKALHDGWFEVFEAEVAWWVKHFRQPCPDCEPPGSGNGHVFPFETGPTPRCPACGGSGKMYPHMDKEPFRPALDRARWALPGTIASGCCHTGHLRERARVLHDGMCLAQQSRSPAVQEVWSAIRKGYEDALPGMAGMGLREAVYNPPHAHIPGHLEVGSVPPTDEVTVLVYEGRRFLPPVYRRPAGERCYVDPTMNHMARVEFVVQCSLAVSRDWHRHRTMYPWSLDIVRCRRADIARAAERGIDRGLFFDDGICIHPAYEPESDIAKDRLPGLLKASTEAFDHFMAEGNQMQAMLCLPLGTRVQMVGQAGLRDAIYTLELRRDAHGANFEYKAQATEALKQLKEQLTGHLAITKHLGLQV